ncbi:E3 ubiquitin-protein ligase SHPRH-like isoform X2 [Argopecten irradians]|uniref:E3 ubiquitin-protein ligase SHPRH-like isoform X2 n=1 Tax=Argopecten irradians TaxID=31199 RepID=UPI0037249956
MGKRKQGAPQRASEDKRRCLEWNMFDGVSPEPEGSLTVLDDNDPSILNEAQQLQGSSQRKVTDTINMEQQPEFSTQQTREMFEDNMTYCSYSIQLMSSLPFKENEWHTKLGVFNIELLRKSEECQPNGHKEIWLYVSEVAGKSMLYIEEGENEENSSMAVKLNYWCVDINIPINVLAALDMYNTKMVVVTIGQFDPATLRFELTIHAREALLYNPKFPSEHVNMKKINILLKLIMSHFYGLSPLENYQGICCKKHDIENLYTAIKTTHDQEETTVDVEVQHPSLIPCLRPYQRKGVSWMLTREGFKVSQGQATDNSSLNTELPLHMLYDEVKTIDGSTLFYNKYLGSLTKECQKRLAVPLGGILADEMGLGKTVEVLACILLHKSPVIESPPKLPTLKEMKIENDGNGRLIDVKYVHVKVMCKSQSTLPVAEDTKCIHVDALPEDKVDRVDNSTGRCVEEDLHGNNSDGQTKDGSIENRKIKNEEMDDVQDEGRQFENGQCAVEDVQLEDKKEEEIQMEDGKVEQKQEDGKEEGEHVRNGPLKEESRVKCMDQGTSDLANNCKISSPKEIEKVVSNDLLNKDIKDSNMDTSNSGHGDLQVKGEGYDDSTRLKVNGEVTGGTKKISEMNGEDMEEIQPGEQSRVEEAENQSMEEDSLPTETGSQKKKKVVKKRRRKKWTTKKKPRRSSHFCIVDLGDSSVEGVEDGAVVENGEVNNESCKEDPQEPQVPKGNKKKKKSVKIKQAEANNEGKTCKATKESKSVKKQTNQSTKRCGVPSRFVEIVEQSSFKPKYHFSSEGPIKRHNFFECICGAKTAGSGKMRHSVQCVDCGLQQHAECVHYDLEDPLRGNFRCPHCHVSAPPIKSGATLIISPSSICHQWVDEILKHIRSQSLKVFVYTGVNKLGFIQPRTLANQDIVITTYETLRKEIDYVDLPHSNSDTTRRFRNPKRFMATPSPMTAVEWWRVCLDEAQMVEATTSKTAEMALRLSAVNRWCVTGTPIQKSVSDVYGLLLFLGLDPYWVKHWWMTLLYDPYCHGNPKPLQTVLSCVLWRNAKKDVLDQINIPSQSEHVHWLTFSPVEDHFYRRQYNECATVARRSYSKWTDLSTKLSSLDRHTVSQLLSPLLKLRQACCHPQAVRGEFIPLQKNTMTMEELLESLTKKAQLECEESHRQLVAAINGTAGLHIIKEEYKEAVETYREVLWSVEEHKEYLRTDKLQLLHTLYNLNEILSLKPEGVAPTLRDDQLKGQAEDLKNNYMTKAEAKVTTSQSALMPTQQSMAEFRAELSDGLEWWLEVIKIAEARQTDEILVEMVKSELLRDYVDNHNNPTISMARLFQGSRGLELAIHGKLVALESAHEKLLQGIGKLCEPVNQDMLNRSVECCLRPVGEVLKSCQLCLVDKLFEEYESKLFSFTQKPTAIIEGDHPSTTKRQGTWADSELEKSLKAILSFAKLYKVGHDLVEFGGTHIKLMDALKKEFKNLRSVWISKHEQFQALDELEMATTRLRLRLPDEDVPNTTQLNVLEPADLEQQKLKLRTEKIVATNELRKKVGQLFYLKNLAKNQVDNEEGINPEPCPICQRELGKEWSVVQCGHCYCIECIRVMVVKYSFGNNNRRLKCAVCRQLNFISDISYVSTKVAPDSEGVDGVRVKGSYSIKIESVVRCMLGIQKNDPTAKVLVFSSLKL